MLAPSGGGLILYQAYGNLYAMTANWNLRELSGEEAWDAIENFAQGQKEWDNPRNIISEQEVANLKARAKGLFKDENVWVKIHRGRKAYLLEDKQIPSVGVLNRILLGIFAFWKALGEIHIIGSFGEDTGKSTRLRQHHYCSGISLQWLETASQIQRDAVTMKIKTVSRDSKTASEHTTQPII
ncbi:hypothetical protein Tco_0150095 [Tanacetum coccineum]